MTYVSVTEYLMGRATLSTLPKQYVANLNTLIPRVNDLLEQFGEYRKVTSGYRRPEDNAKVPNPKSTSAHLSCEAVDLDDRDSRLKKWILANLAILAKCDLYMEAAAATPTWCHLQCRRPKSGNRVFNP